MKDKKVLNFVAFKRDKLNKEPSYNIIFRRNIHGGKKEFIMYTDPQQNVCFGIVNYYDRDTATYMCDDVVNIGENFPLETLLINAFKLPDNVKLK